MIDDRVQATTHNDRFAFISYKSEDYTRIEPYLQTLADIGYRFWYDRELKPGEKWQPQLMHRIKRCNAFVCFVTELSMSDSSFVIKEVNYAIRKRKKILMFKLDDTAISPKINKRINAIHEFRDYRQTNADLRDLFDFLNKNEVIKDTPVSGHAHSRCVEHYKTNKKIMEIGELNKDLFAPIFRKGTNEQVEDLVGEITRIDPESLSKHVYIEAAGGYGKTYRIFDTMKKLLDCDRMVAYVPCVNINEDHNIYAHLRSYLPVMRSDPETMKSWFSAHSKKPFILFLDGFNENVNQPLLQNAIHDLMYVPGLQLVISSRYERPFFGSFHKFELKELSFQDVERILNAHGRDSKNMNRSMRKVLQTPMFLSLYLSSTDGQYETAAALMQQDVQRLLDRYAVQRGGEDSTPNRQLENVLNKVFPSFVHYHYTRFSCSLIFSKTEFENFVDRNAKEFNYLSANEILTNLLQHRIILNANTPQPQFFYRHEHWRDYWVAFYLYQKLLRFLGGTDQNTNPLNRVQEYSDIVLEHLGALLGETRLIELLDRLRLPNSASPEDTNRFQSDECARLTNRVLRICKQLYKTDDNAYTFPSNFLLHRLNLTKTNLSMVACKKRAGHLFERAILSLDTFAPVSHESAVRRVELIKIDAVSQPQTRTWCVSFGNSDILFSVCPDLHSRKRVSYKNRLQNLIDCTKSIRESVLGINRDHDCWYWRFSEHRDDEILEIATECLIPDIKAVEVTLYRTVNTLCYALLLTNGDIIFLEPNRDGCKPCMPHCHTGMENAVATNYTFTSQAEVTNGFLFWAEPYMEQDTQRSLRIMRYQPDGSHSAECIIELETDYKPDRMTYQPEKDLLVLSTVNEEKMQLYQISNATEGMPAVQKLRWPDGKDLHSCPLEKTETGLQNRINSIEYNGPNMVLTNNMGMLYLFSYDDTDNCYKPNPNGHTLQLSESSFPANDAKFIDSNTLVVASIKRWLYIVTLNPLQHLHTVRGRNHGLRKLYRLSDDILLALSYDGCVLQLRKHDLSYRCMEKIYVGSWAWSLAQISSNKFVVGCMERLQMIDSYERIGEPYQLPQRAEALVYLDGLIYCGTISGIDIFEADNRNGPQKKGSIRAVEGKTVYSLLVDGKELLVGCSESDKTKPQLLRLRKEGQEWVPAGSPFALGEHSACYDLKACGNLLVAIGMKHSSGKNRDCYGRLCSYDNDQFTMLADTTEPLASATRCEICQEADGTYRILILANTYSIYDYRWNGKTLELKHTFDLPDRPCDIVIEENGSLLVCCLNGCLYQIDSGMEQQTELFRNLYGFMFCNRAFESTEKEGSTEQDLADIMKNFNNGWIRRNNNPS